MMLSKAVRSGLITIGLVCSSLSLLPLSSTALTVDEVPNPRASGSWVSDMADLLDPEAEMQLNRLIERNEQNVGTEIAVVTVPTTVPAASPEAFALELFNTWGIGKAEKNNGVLILISQSERRTEVTLGTGIAKTISDEAVEQIIRTEMTPEFRRGDFNAGAIAGTEALIARTNSGAEANAIFIIVSGLGIVAMGWVGYKAIVRPRKRKPLDVESPQVFQGRPIECPRPSPSLVARAEELNSSRRARKSSAISAGKPATRKNRTRTPSRYAQGSWGSYSSNDSGSFGGGGSDGAGGGDSW